MFNKINQHRALAMLAGLLMIGGGATYAEAATAECGQAKLLEAGSVGVNIDKNDCEDKSRIKVGSVLELTAGSRLWLKFDPSASGEVVQLICQNKSAEAVSVNFANASTPWIAPQGLKHCSKWTENKLSCDDNSGEKNSFFCAVSTSKLVGSNGAPQQTTSVKLRSILPKLISVDDVIKEISPEINLCKSLYNVNTKVEMSWTVSNTGMIKDLQVKTDNKDLINCFESVVKQANANQELTIKHAF